MGVTVTESQGVMAVSPAQSDYNTGVTPATTPANFRQEVAASYISVPEFASPNVGNQGEATGSAYSTKNNKGRADASGSFDIFLTFEELGFWAYRSFGDYTVAAVVSGVYRHTFKLLNPQLVRELPAWMLAVKLNEAALSSNEVYNKKFRGCKVETIQFSTPHNAEKPYLTANVAWHGSGKREAGDVKFFGSGKHVIGTGSGELGTEQRIPENGTMSIYSQPSKGGTAYALGCDFYNFQASINENLNMEIGYSGCQKFQIDNDPTSAQIRGSLPITEQVAAVEFSAKLTPELKAAADFEALMEAGTALSADWTFLGKIIGATIYNQKATFSLNKFTIGGISYPTIDSVRGIQIATQPEAVSSVMPLELEIISPVADFSTFVGS
ncbi:MAG: hypothetical protein LUM44_17610 [Pyrinomonadaceae bacterium]|nr:hypothetical protein [Pyrinomonadaceae bacterium]